MMTTTETQNQSRKQQHKQHINYCIYSLQYPETNVLHSSNTVDGTGDTVVIERRLRAVNLCLGGNNVLGKHSCIA